MKSNHHEVDVLDLYRDGFDPVYSAEDEQDWQHTDKTYAPHIRKEMDRVLDADALVFVFPIWWYRVPAMLKGYLDKVWNMGLFGQVSTKQVLWIALAGGSERVFDKYNYTHMITDYLNNGIAGYAGLQDSTVEFLYDTLSDSDEHIAGLLEQAYQLGENYN
ncbi:hypothetical protein D3C74_02200 [compost metagenome]